MQKKAIWNWPFIHVITKSNFRCKWIRWIVPNLVSHRNTKCPLLLSVFLSFESLNSLWCNVDVTLSKHKNTTITGKICILRENSHPKRKKKLMLSLVEGYFKRKVQISYLSTSSLDDIKISSHVVNWNFFRPLFLTQYRPVWAHHCSIQLKHSRFF
jgi:hypothetical protein